MNINLDFHEIKLHSIYTHCLLLVLLEEDWWKTILNIQNRNLHQSSHPLLYYTTHTYMPACKTKCTLSGLHIATEKVYKFIILESVYHLHEGISFTPFYQENPRGYICSTLNIIIRDIQLILYIKLNKLYSLKKFMFSFFIHY